MTSRIFFTPSNPCHGFMYIFPFTTRSLTPHFYQVVKWFMMCPLLKQRCHMRRNIFNSIVNNLILFAGHKQTTSTMSLKHWRLWIKNNLCFQVFKEKRVAAFHCCLLSMACLFLHFEIKQFHYKEFTIHIAKNIYSCLRQVISYLLYKTKYKVINTKVS